MSTLRAVSNGVAWTTIGTVVGKVLVLVNVLIILKHLSVFNYGVAELVFSTVSIVGIITLPGLASTIMADMGVERGRDNRGRMKAIFSQYLSLTLLLSIVAFLVLFLGATIVASLSGNPSIGYFIQIVSFTFLIAPVRSVALLLANVHMRFIDRSLYSIVEEVAKTVCLVVFLFVFNMNIDGLLYAAVLSQAAAAILFLPRTISGYRYFASTRAEREYHFWELVGAHRKWSVISSYVGTVTQNAQLWIIKLMLGTEAVGLFAFAAGIYGNVAGLLPFTSVFTSLGPRYITKKEEFIRLIRTSVKAQFLVAVVLVVVAYTLLPLLIWILPKYAPAVPMTLIVLLVLIPTATTSVFTPTFAILKEQFSFFLTQTIKLIVTLIVMPLSILTLGILGVGLGSLAINTLSGFERYYRLRSKLPGFSLSLRDLFVLTPYQRSVLRSMREQAFSPSSLRKLLIEKDVTSPRETTTVL